MNTPKEEPQNYILVCVEKPNIEPHAPLTWKWLTLTNEITKIPSRFAGFERLCENEFLYSEKTHLLTAMQFVDYCRRVGDSGLNCKAYRILGKPELVEFGNSSPAAQPFNI
jgi:hypothetical protein